MFEKSIINTIKNSTIGYKNIDKGKLYILKL